ncbi:probable aspartate aminotransferase [Cyanidioschyzon merolae strain 10D]|jgi:LL-diaminopimelate aminotransferase|uniref:Probable aspartate aminotransferase n=1 Tax=Cyanidioschyzon merolae (strain NIES-3377 / 10D) TaxID=280699 RepID=M1VEP9_CYAM1|nr:probable aspartate aminotransferase [Cyanidioschyzon merolae strain 10D]BAM81392.1 probable aspartate aminotransferase [Cyanidioschyzon merolae strain 10D]|eukprot:XP_005537428.1 probable aspartate aminotransferase [Cyanidioschyzon merolae strain 10D]
MYVNSLCGSGWLQKASFLGNRSQDAGASFHQVGVCRVARHANCRASSPLRRFLAMHTRVPRNENFSKLQGGYLFPQIAQRRREYLEKHPDAALISLGIGDTTQPIPPHICAGLTQGAKKLATKEGYSGYGDGEGLYALRKSIASRLYGDRIRPEEVFVSDGAKCDIARLQMVFGSEVTVAVQDPSYPVYVDTAVMTGQTGRINADTRQYAGIVYMRCDAANDFFPDLSKTPRTDLIFFCSPNNPTGAAATREQLAELVAFARHNGSIIVYDAAYAPFIRDPAVPRSILEIDGALECAIEVNSFSKYAGFTGVRLGWTVVPSALRFADGTPVAKDFGRVMNTAFNGASNIAQQGGMACLDDEGLAEIEQLISYYLENTRILREGMESLGFSVYGGRNAPYIWVRFPGRSSWDVFTEFLEKCQVVTVPGAGFGPAGVEYVRLSAFAPREACQEAVRRIQTAFGGRPADPIAASSFQ